MSISVVGFQSMFDALFGCFVTVCKLTHCSDKLNMATYFVGQQEARVCLCVHRPPAATPVCLSPFAGLSSFDTNSMDGLNHIVCRDCAVQSSDVKLAVTIKLNTKGYNSKANTASSSNITTSTTITITTTTTTATITTTINNCSYDSKNNNNNNSGCPCS